MTPDELKAIRARAEWAKPGPWKVGQAVYRDGKLDGWYYDAHISNTESGDVVLCLEDDDAGICTDVCMNTLDFIAHARTDIPALLAELAEARRAEEDNARWYQEVGVMLNASEEALEVAHHDADAANFYRLETEKRVEALEAVLTKIWVNSSDRSTAVWAEAVLWK